LKLVEKEQLISLRMTLVSLAIKGAHVTHLKGETTEIRDLTPEPGHNMSSSLLRSPSCYTKVFLGYVLAS
jgi:hypothetical protein